MVVETKMDTNATLPNRQMLVLRMQKIDAKFSVVVDPAMTIGKLHEMMLTLGIRPEDNESFREIVRLRDEQHLTG